MIFVFCVHLPGGNPLKQRITSLMLKTPAKRGEILGKIVH